MSPGKALLVHVEQLLTEKYGPPSLRRLPEGLRLELHPYTSHLLWRDAELALFVDHRTPAGILGVPDMDGMFGLPVKVTTDIPRGDWRLVIVTEEVLSGGTLTPPAEG